MMRLMRTVPGRLLPAVLALLTGCASLPDMAPYRDATLELRSAVVAGGSAVQSGLESVAASYEAGDPTARQIKEESDRFGTAWRARIEGADALVAYTEAVSDIARSGTQGDASARALADALAGLASGVGVVLPPAGSVATVTDIAAFVYGHIAAARAARSLEQALQSAQPAVDRLATVLSQDLQASLDILHAARRLQATALALKFNEETAYLKTLARERKTLYGKDPLTPADEQRLRQIGELFEATREWREPMEQHQAELEAQYRLRIQLINATQAAVAEWAAAHRSLAAAVRENRGVNVEALVQATQEAQELVRRLRTL
jgi:hypothetical protein